MLALVAAVLLGAAAPAAPSVLVLQVDAEPVRAGLVDALRIHLRGHAEVRPASRPIRRVALAAMLDEAAEEARAAGSSFAIWTEPGASSPGQIEVILYIASDRPGRALVEVVRIAARADGPDVDRALAVKVGEVLRATAMVEEVVLAGGLATPAQRAPPRAPVAPLLAVGVSRAQIPSRTADTSGLLIAGAGVDLSAIPLSLELRTALRFGGSLGVETDAGRVDVSDNAVSLAAVGFRAAASWRAGGGVGIGARRLSAEGTTAGGASGDAIRWTSFVSVGGEARIRLIAGLELGASLGMEIVGQRQRFSLNQMEVVDVGRSRLVGDLFLLISTR